MPADRSPSWEVRLELSVRIARHMLVESRRPIRCAPRGHRDLFACRARFRTVLKRCRRDGCRGPRNPGSLRTCTSGVWRRLLREEAPGRGLHGAARLSELVPRLKREEQALPPRTHRKAWEDTETFGCGEKL